MFPSAINKLSLAAVLTAAAGLAGTASGAWSQGAPKPQRQQRFPIRSADLKLPEAVPSQLVVRLAPGASPQQIAQAYGIRVNRPLRGVANTYIFDGVQGDLRRAAGVLNNTVGVVNASPNWVGALHALPTVVPSDPLRSQQWALAVQNAQSFWGVSVGQRLAGGFIGNDPDPSDGEDDEDVVVAVLDAAVKIDHPDLEDNIAFDSTGGDGWDAVTDTPYDSDSVDHDFGLNSHGTNVAGCVAAINNNGIGVSSLSWEGVKVLPVRVANDFGGVPIGDLLEGLNFAIAENVDVINMSLGFGPFFFDQPVADAIATAHSAGIVVVASTGNSRFSGTSPGVSFPARLDEVIAVGSVGPNGEIADYSDGGPHIDVVAPGGNQIAGITAGVLTTDPHSFSFGPAPLGYDFVQGTSFSSPYAAGAVATLISQGARDTTLSGGEQVERIRQYLQKTARNTVGTFNNDYGFGIIDPGAALREFTQYVDVTTPSPNEVTASFSEPLQAFVFQNEIQPNPSGPPGDYTRIPFPFVLDPDPTDDFADGVGVLHSYQGITTPLEVELDNSGQVITYEPTAETRYGIGNNDLDFQVPNAVDPDPSLVRSLIGDRVEWTGERTGNTRVIPARSFRFRVLPRVELPGVRMMSVPYALQGGADTIDFLFGGNLVRLARWLPEQNRYAYWNLNPGDGPQEPEADITTTSANVDEPPVGVGFFARTVSTTQVQLLGRSERRPVYRIPLRTGFNMIGNPYPFRVPWNTVSIEIGGREVVTLDEAFRRGLIRNTLWRFVDGRYTFTALPHGALEAWEAHWLRAFSNDLVLIVPRISAVLQNSASSTVPSAAPLDGWKRGIRLTAAGKLAGEVIVGQAGSARNGFGPEDVETPPPAGTAADLRIRNRNWGPASGAYVQDIRRKQGGLQQWVLEVETSKPGTPVKLTWDRFPGAVAASLRVDGTDRRVDLSRPGSLELKAKSAGVKRVLLTTAAVPGA